MTVIAPPFIRHTTGPLPCTADPELFHLPDEGTGQQGQRGAPARSREAAAVALCRTCPVMLACRQWAQEHAEEGVWGAQTDEQRPGVPTPHLAPQKPSQPDCGTPAGAQWHRRHGSGKPCTECLAAETAASQARKEAREAAASLWPPHLTPREREVLGLWCAGRDRKSIQWALGMSRGSVVKRMSSLRRKLRVGTDRELAAVAERLGLVQPAAAAGFGRAA